MDLILRIGGDPASWVVLDADYEALVAQLHRATAPVIIEVTAPLTGRLVLSPKAAGSVVILQPPGGAVWRTTDWNPGGAFWKTTDWNPGGAIKPGAARAPIVYLASPAGPGTGTSRYAVSGDVNAQGVVQDIVTAMSDGTKRMLSLPVYDPSGTGVLVIDGAALPFAVVC